MTKKTAPPPLAYPKAAQADLDAGRADNCPTCGRPWGRIALRVCRLCGQPISNNHKWRMVPAGPGLFAIEHRNCDQPRTYLSAEAKQ